MSDRFGLLHDATFSRDLQVRHPDLDFLEIIPDRFIGVNHSSGLSGSHLAIPTVFHCLNLSLGSDEALDRVYLKDISRLAEQFKPMWISDHLAFTHVNGMHLGHLSPVRWSTDTIARIVSKIEMVQAELQMRFLIENIAYYFRIPGSDMAEGELLQRLVERTGCGLLLDLNNVVVNAANHGFDPYAYLREFPLHAVGEIHIAGHRKRGNTYIDSHGDPVGEQVWNLLRFVSRELNPINVILERDQDMPPLRTLLQELEIARKCVTEGRSSGSVGGPK